MARHFVIRRLAILTASLAVMVVTLAPVRGAFEARCCCSPQSVGSRSDGACSLDTAAANSCCGGAAEESIKPSCCRSDSAGDSKSAGDGDVSLDQSCDCDGCGCDLVAVGRSVATVENSSSFVVSALNQLDSVPLVYAALSPVQLVSPILATTAHQSCVRLCRWLK